jgi:hypothetical protein
MYRLADTPHIWELAAAGIAAAALLGLLFFSRSWFALLWALLLSAVAASIVLFPEQFKDSIVLGCAAAAFLIFLSELRSKRKHRLARAELDKLSAAIAEIQNRELLAEVRLAGTPRAPAADKTELSGANQRITSSTES